MSSYEEFLTRIQLLDLQGTLSQLKKDLENDMSLKVIGWWLKYLAQSKIPQRPKQKPVPPYYISEGEDWGKYNRKCYEIERSNTYQSVMYNKTHDEWVEWQSECTRTVYNVLEKNYANDWSEETDSQFLVDFAYNLMLTTTIGSDMPTNDTTILGVKTILAMMCGNPSFATAVSKNDGAIFFATVRTLSGPFEYNDTLRVLYEKTINTQNIREFPPDVEQRLSKKKPAKVLDDGTSLFNLHHELFNYLSYPYHIAKLLSGVLARKIGVLPRFPAYVRSVDISNFLRDVFDNYELKSMWPYGEGTYSRSTVWSCNSQESTEKMVQSFLDWQQSQHPMEWSRSLVSSLLSLYKYDEKMYAINRLHTLADLVEGWSGYHDDGSPIGDKINRKCLAMALEFILAVRQPSSKFEISAKKDGSIVVVYPVESSGELYENDDMEIEVTFNLDGNYKMKTTRWSSEISSDEEM